MSKPTGPWQGLSNDELTRLDMLEALERPEVSSPIQMFYDIGKRLDALETKEAIHHSIATDELDALAERVAALEQGKPAAIEYT